jgi:hypothetical protein
VQFVLVFDLAVEYKFHALKVVVERPKELLVATAGYEEVLELLVNG